jgi:hypothetical protein
LVWFAVLGFELRALSLLGRCSTALATSPTPFLLSHCFHPNVSIYGVIDTYFFHTLCYHVLRKTDLWQESSILIFMHKESVEISQPSRRQPHTQAWTRSLRITPWCPYGCCPGHSLQSAALEAHACRARWGLFQLLKVTPRNVSISLEFGRVQNQTTSVIKIQ